MNDLSTRTMMNESVADRVFRLRFGVDWASYAPGQFVMVDIPGNETFLRRPFGIARLDGGVADIYYKVVGKGTAALSRLPVGSELQVLGPCGRGFDIFMGDDARTTNDERRTTVLIAGGYGIAPLYGLAGRLKGAGRDVRLFYGAVGKADLFLVDEMKALGIEVNLATEDGTAGAKGIVTDLLTRRLPDIHNPRLFACGPKGLLKAVADIGRENGLATQVSLENYMACGIGVCLGCVCKDSDGGYVRVCREGPVFDIEDIVL